MTQVLIEPGGVNADWTLRQAALASGAKFAETGVHELAGSGLPGTADASGVGFAAEGVAADRLEIGTDVQTCAAPNTVKRLVEYGILAHSGAAVVDEHKMEFAR